MALIIILLKAGLSLDLADLKKAGRSAVLLSFLPATFEILAYVVFAPIILGITHTEAAVLGFSFLLVSVESCLEGKVAVSGLLAVVSMACVLKLKSPVFVSKRLSEKFGKLWLAAEVMLFVLMGAAVDIRYTLDAGAAAVGMIFVALVFRALGMDWSYKRCLISVK